MNRVCKRMMSCALVSLLAVNFYSSDAEAQKKKKKAKGQEPASETAATDDPQIKAREFYSSAKAAYDAGDFQTALKNFQAAYEAKPHSSVKKSIAECHVQLGNYTEAMYVYRELLNDPTYDKKEDAQNRLREIGAEVAEVSVETIPSGATVSVDGTVQSTATPMLLYLKPGERKLFVSVDGYEPREQKIVALKGDRTTLQVDMTQPPPSEVELEDPFADDATTGDSTDSDITAPALDDAKGPPPAFWAMASVAGVGLVSGIVFGTSALRDEKDYEDTGSSATKKSGERSAIIADVSFGIAIGAAIAGTIILIVDNKKKNRQTGDADSSISRVRITPAAGSNGAGLFSTVNF